MGILTQNEINALLNPDFGLEPELLTFCCMDYYWKQLSICKQCHKRLCVKNQKGIQVPFCNVEYACDTKNQTHQGWWRDVELCLCCANKNANKRC